MKRKVSRIQAIKEIITTVQVSSQEELLKLLAERGFQLTQATLSRNLKQMKVIKSLTDTGEYVYILPTEEMNRNLPGAGYSFADKSFISLHFSGNIAVIKTRPGYASSIASEIDEKAANETLGTVAGDDTIFIVMKENITPYDLRKVLSTFIPNLN